VGRAFCRSRTADRHGYGNEAISISPLILDPFLEDVPIPLALAPVTDFTGWATVPSKGQHNSHNDGGHQFWGDEFPGCAAIPNVYKIALQVGEHRITNGKVQSLQFADGMGSGTIDDIIDVDQKGAAFGRPVRRVGRPSAAHHGLRLQRHAGSAEHPELQPDDQCRILEGQFVRFENQLDQTTAWTSATSAIRSAAS
jgi:hypothetical protein